jgi:hypothetical protein
MSERRIVELGLDPVADRWTIGLWDATADLHFCLYFHREEGEFDSAGRWRRRNVRHCIVGRPVNQARATAMAEHFCGLVRLSARAYAGGSGNPHLRRSFQMACAERLAKRLRAALAAVGGEPDTPQCHAAERAGNEKLLREAGIAPQARPAPDGSFDWDRAAVRHGKAAAENISLVLRGGPAIGAHARPSRVQMQLPF